LHALSSSKAPEALSALRSALQAGDERLRGQAVAGLAMLGGPDAERELIRASGDSSPSVQSEVASQLPMFGSASALRELERLSESPHGVVIERALGGLVALAPERAEARVRTLSESSDPAQLRVALSFAHMLSDSASLSATTRALGSGDVELVGLALSGLQARGYAASGLQGALQSVAHNAALPEDQRVLAQHLALEAGATGAPE
jgi:HEAT repeat protein